jgi:hypothetical protein
MQDFQKSPAGWWYCSVIRHTKPALPGEDRPQQTTVRYSFDFTGDFPEFGPARIK